MRLFQLSDRIALTLWVGGMWTVGYLVAPLLFQTLPERALAGRVAGELFSAMSFIGLVCGMLLLVAAVLRSPRQWWRQWRSWAVALMLSVVVVGEFVVQPMMAELKASALDGAVAAEFGRLHGVASALFALNSLLGLILVIAGPSPVREQS